MPICTARITPTQVSASASFLDAIVRWIFDEDLETYVKKFDIEVIPDMFHDGAKKHISPPSSRVAAISGLASGRGHTVRVIAVYCDDGRAESNIVHFTTPCTCIVTEIAYLLL